MTITTPHFFEVIKQELIILSFFSTIIYRWHIVKMRYNQQLFESCLDADMRALLKKKISYHLNKAEKSRETPLILETIPRKKTRAAE